MNGKPSSPVLRGLGASNGARLLDHWDLMRLGLTGFWFNPRESHGSRREAATHAMRSNIESL
jgi:hypothetical protein